MPETRLSAAEVAPIARDAASDSDPVDLLVMQGPEKDGRIVRHLMTLTRGSMLSVLMDDTTGRPK